MPGGTGAPVVAAFSSGFCFADQVLQSLNSVRYVLGGAANKVALRKIP